MYIYIPVQKNHAQSETNIRNFENLQCLSIYINFPTRFYLNPCLINNIQVFSSNQR